MGEQFYGEYRVPAPRLSFNGGQIFGVFVRVRSAINGGRIPVAFRTVERGENENVDVGDADFGFLEPWGQVHVVHAMDMRPT